MHLPRSKQTGNPLTTISEKWKSLVTVVLVQCAYWTIQVVRPGYYAAESERQLALPSSSKKNASSGFYQVPVGVHVLDYYLYFATTVTTAY